MKIKTLILGLFLGLPGLLIAISIIMALDEIIKDTKTYLKFELDKK